MRLSSPAIYPSKRLPYLAAALTAALALVLSLGACLSRPPVPAEGPGPAPAAEAGGVPEPLPVDPQVKIGRLDNGLTFYIRTNRWPEKRAELRLAVNAGSILEEEDQLGLAHFLEHMAFNGTESFEKQQIVDYMESIGMRFGPEVNAYTDFDETVYFLTLPTDDLSIVETGVKILEEWGHRILLDPAEVDKERGVIVEEWRLGRGAEARMEDRQWPIVYRGSRYADRLPIGKPEVIREAPVEALRRYYRDWYRPDLMAVVAVGDFDPGWMEQLIRARFSALRNPESPRERPSFPVPDNAEVLYAPATDPEATTSRVSLLVKRPVEPLLTISDYRKRIAGSLYHAMMNERLDELSRKPGSPLLYGYSESSRIVRTKEGYTLSAGVREERIEEALETLLTEAERARRFGFTPSELERHKKRLATAMERMYKEREKIESEAFASLYAAHFLENEPIPSIEDQYGLYQRLLPLISLEEINALAGELLTETNRAVQVNAPEKALARVPGEARVLALFRQARSQQLDPWQDRTAEEPLFRETLKPGAVQSRRELAELGVTEWRLANGVRVVLQPTTFKEDQVLFSAFSPGGTSLVADRDYIAAVTAATLVTEGGVDGLDAVELRKKLAGKAASVSPFIGELYEGLRGGGRPEDLETLFQLIHLYFTEPREDQNAYLGFRERLKEVVKNRQASPEVAFADRVQVLLAQNHFRARPWSAEILEEMDLGKSMEIYRDRFRDAGDFTFIFVGSFQVEQIEPLVTLYLGSLPAEGRVESWRDTGIDPPRGQVREEVRKGLEPKSRVELVFSGQTAWSLERRLELAALAQILDIKLREVVREEAGGSYDVEAYAEMRRYPDEEYFVAVEFGCAPEQVETLSAFVLGETERLRKDGPVPGDLAKVKEILRREHERNLKENDYWVGTLQLAYSNDLDPRTLLEFDGRVERLSVEGLKRVAVEHLKPDNYLRVVLYPEQ